MEKDLPKIFVALRTVRNMCVAAIFIIIAAVLVQTAFAAGDTDAFALAIRGVTETAEKILWGLAVMMVGVAGVQYITSGSSEGVKEARSTLTYAITGLIFYYLGCLLIPNCVSGAEGLLGSITAILRQT